MHARFHQTYIFQNSKFNLTDSKSTHRGTEALIRFFFFKDRNTIWAMGRWIGGDQPLSRVAAKFYISKN